MKRTDTLLQTWHDHGLSMLAGLLALLGWSLAAAAEEPVMMDHRIVNTGVAYGTMTVTPACGQSFDDLNVPATETYLSEELAGMISVDGLGPPWSELILDYGSIPTNLEFLMEDLEILGNPVDAVVAKYEAYRDEISETAGPPTTFSWTTIPRGTRVYTLLGSVIEDHPGCPGETVIVTGDAYVDFYEVNAIATFGTACPDYECIGFGPPMDDGPVTVRGFGRALPLSARLHSEAGIAITDAKIAAPPILHVEHHYHVEGEQVVDDVSDDVVPAALVTEGNEFVYLGDGKWEYILNTGNFTGEGHYILTMKAGSPDYLIGQTCEASFVRQK